MDRRAFVKAGIALCATGAFGNRAVANSDMRLIVPPEDDEHQRTFMQWPVNRQVYPDGVFLDIMQETIADIANAIAAFEIDAFTLHDAPWDKFLAGDNSALDEQQLRGAQLFYGKADCVKCHSGRLMTDQLPHNIGVVPIGPGPSEAEDLDFGVTHRSDFGFEDKYAFRTPPLRNVELTGPYMHNGAYSTLEAVVKHHLNPVQGLREYDEKQLEPEFRGAVHNDQKTIKDVMKTMPPELKLPSYLEENEIDDLVAFLKALTSPQARDLSSTIPDSVPSGLEMVLPFPPDTPPATTTNH